MPSEDRLWSTDEELKADFVRSAKRYLEGKQEEAPSGSDFPELTADEMEELWAIAKGHVD